LPAQTSYSLVPFIARDGSLPGTPTQGGLAFSTRAGIMGTRLGGALGLTSTTNPSTNVTTTTVTSWTADVDALLTPTRAPGAEQLFAGFDLTGFVGVGTEGVRLPDWRLASAPNWSYGVALGRTIVGGLGVESEARYRTPFALEGMTIPENFVRGWEYRAGLSLRFGGGSAPSRSGARRGWPVASADESARRPRVSAARIIDTADDYLGTPYVYGGTSPSTGFDCSGFVQYVFGRYGVRLPRTSRQMAFAGDALVADVAALRPGDLLLFAQNRSRVDHVAIYAGGNRIIHASSSGDGVRYDDLDSRRGRWFLEHVVAARRVIDDGRSLVSEAVASLRAAADELDPPDRAPRP
jgi:cell wall-associated NlpC family hydrolase